MNIIHINEINTNLNTFEIFKHISTKKYCIFLDSNINTNSSGNYSYIGFEPFLRIETKNNTTKVISNGFYKEYNGNPFNILQKYLKLYKIINHKSFPFVGGAIGYFSYDLYNFIEDIPNYTTDDIKLPDLSIGFYNKIIIINNKNNKKFFSFIDFNNTYFDEKNIITDIITTLEKSRKLDFKELNYLYKDNKIEFSSNLSRIDYNTALKKIKNYIFNGDVYQINMTQRFSTKINKHPINIYDKLRTINPAPFSAFLDFKHFKILSSSPERFIKLENGIVETKPIKGTAPKSNNIEENNKNINFLKNSEKDKAENLMIVDLMRNDLGKVCEFNSIEVPKLFDIEEYATVYHLVSTITGKLKKDLDAVDCLKSIFPGGSITGAPKVSALRIIEELEPTKRSIYTGSIGYIGFDGNMDLNIAIRTIIIKNDIAYYQTGGGIVWDSDTDNEFEESLNKGKALKEALS